MCMFVYVHMHEYICVDVYMCASIYVCVYVCAHECGCGCICVCMCKGHKNRKGAVRGKGDKRRAGVEKRRCGMHVPSSGHCGYCMCMCTNMNIGINFKITSYCKGKEILTTMLSVCTQLLRDQSDHC